MIHIFIEDDNKENKDDLYDITSTVKPVDEEFATAEAEKGESILSNDLSAIYRVLGNKHYNGGTPLALRDGDFVFSNDPSMSLTPGEKKLLEINYNVKGKKSNTPAKIAQKLVKHDDYNRMVQILEDPNRDAISKSSASLMLKKYIETLGNIAYAQENKKEGEVPEFAYGSAPVYNADLVDEMDRQEQFKRGGMFQQGGGFRLPFNRPYEGQFGEGYYPLQELIPPVLVPPQRRPTPTNTRQRNPYGIYLPTGNEATPTGQSPIFNYPTGVLNTSQQQDEITQGLLPEWQQAGVNINGKTNKQIQSEIYDWALTNNPEILRNMWSQYGNTKKGIREGLNTQDLSVENLQRLKSAYVDGFLGARTIGPTRDPKRSELRLMRPNAPNVQPSGTPNPFTTNTTVSEGVQLPDPNNPNILPYNPNIPFSPLQQLNLLYAGQQALTVPKFYPLRSQIQSPLVELERMNPQSTLNQIDNAANQAYQASRVLNPIIAGAQNASTYGRTLDAKVQALGQFENQNVQIANQQNLINNQIQRQDLQQNIGFNQDYYNNLQTLNQNYANETRFARNRAVDMFNRFASENAQLGTLLQSQRMYTKPVTDAQGNQLYDQSGRPLEQQAPLYDVNLRGLIPQIYYTGAGNLMEAQTQANTTSFFDSTLQKLINQGVPPNTAAIVAGRLAGSKPALEYSVPRIQKLGGKIKRMRK